MDIDEENNAKHSMITRSLSVDVPATSYGLPPSPRHGKFRVPSPTSPGRRTPPTELKTDESMRVGSSSSSAPVSPCPRRLSHVAASFPSSVLVPPPTFNASRVSSVHYHHGKPRVNWRCKCHAFLVPPTFSSEFWPGQTSLSPAGSLSATSAEVVMSAASYERLSIDTFPPQLPDLHLPSLLLLTKPYIACR
jgi:hypothetical protein